MQRSTKRELHSNEFLHQKKKKRERFLNNLMIHHKDLEKLDKLKPN